ncbi:hypothetical protein CAPTEDRAFT_184870 [Capitella teleta]|uniref:Uncharacterized protein n=1 Tax=Capitella teleta TaxID=283909 RepID=X1ZH70_CAPTE|nr:hypothetical protein CAPTEDRAFT_184870 [Capitella teleta]|eukprot:ELT90084.1 hypothetical protein CAPTEDRAFT_184870 [Capitella teleta]
MADSCFDSDSSDDFWNFAAGVARPGTSTAGNVDLSDIEVSSVHTSDLSDFSTGEFSDDNDDSYDSAAMEDVQDGDGWTSRLRDVTLNPFASSISCQVGYQLKDCSILRRLTPSNADSIGAAIIS